MNCVYHIFDFQANFRFSFFVQMANASIVTCSQAFFRPWYSHWFHCAKSLVRLFRSQRDNFYLVLSLNSPLQNLQRKQGHAFSGTTSAIAQLDNIIRYLLLLDTIDQSLSTLTYPNLDPRTRSLESLHPFPRCFWSGANFETLD